MFGKHIYFLQAKINKYGCGDWKTTEAFDWKLIGFI